MHISKQGVCSTLRTAAAELSFASSLLPSISLQTYIERPASIDLRGHPGAFLDWWLCNAAFCRNPPTEACRSLWKSIVHPTRKTSES